MTQTEANELRGRDLDAALVEAMGQVVCYDPAGEPTVPYYSSDDADAIELAKEMQRRRHLVEIDFWSSGGVRCTVTKYPARGVAEYDTLSEAVARAALIALEATNDG